MEKQTTNDTCLELPKYSEIKNLPKYSDINNLPKVDTCDKNHFKYTKYVPDYVIHFLYCFLAPWTDLFVYYNNDIFRAYYIGSIFTNLIVTLISVVCKEQRRLRANIFISSCLALVMGLAMVLDGEYILFFTQITPHMYCIVFIDTISRLLNIYSMMYQIPQTP